MKTSILNVKVGDSVVFNNPRTEFPADSRGGCYLSGHLVFSKIDTQLRGLKG